MLNQTPIWKYILVLLIVGASALYALPNIYGEDHAIQISAGRNAQVTQAMVPEIETILKANDVATKRIDYADGKILVRVNNSDSQLVAREALEAQLGDDYFVAMNLAPDTPQWLAALGGSPMKLGLDLRGGVHFFMEVDMNSAIAKTTEDLVGDFRTALREEKIRYRTVKQVGDAVTIQFRDQETLDKARFFLT